MCLDENDIAELLDGDFRSPRKAELQRHLDACAACRRLLAVAARGLNVDEEDQSLVGAGGELVRAPSAAGMRGGWLPRGSSLGRYLLLDVVGAGGMGVVYAAYDPELDRRVALKVLRDPGGSNAERLRERILREARSMARLSHPNVVAIFDVGEDGGRIFVAMELVEGETLTRWLARGGRPWRELLRVFLQAGLGLEAAHAAGLIHRDFKPDNVLVAADGRVRVGDFGLARSLLDGEDSVASPRSAASARVAPGSKRLTAHGALLGTPAYMAPEVLAGGAADARSDVYSFSVALFEALYGGHPYGGGSAERIRAAIVSGEWRELRGKGAAPAWLRRAVLWGLAPDPEHRCASIAALLRRLERGSQRRRWSIVGVVGAVLVIAGLLVSSAKESHPRPCQGMARHLRGVWDDPRRAEVRSAFLAVGAPAATATWPVVEAALDRYATEWIATRVSACEATRVTGEQSESLLALRFRCLDRRKDELAALTRIFATADAAVVGEAARGALSLTELEGCSDAVELTSTEPPPRDRATASALGEAARELAGYRALKLAGRYAEGRRALEAAIARARGWPSRPLVAEALALLSDFRELTGDFSGAAQALQDALLAAEEGRDRKQAARALAELVWVVGHQQAKHERGLEYGRHAAAILAAVGGDKALEALVEGNVGTVLDAQGKFEASAERFRAALKLREAAYGSGHWRVAGSLVNIGVSLTRLGRQAEALTYYERALLIYERTLGAQHPIYAHTSFNIASTLVELGRLDEGLRRGQEALRRAELAVGKDHAYTASALNVLGLAENGVGRFDDARQHLERALTIARRVRGPDHPFVAHYSTALGESFEGLHRSAAAIRSFRDALAIYVRMKERLFEGRTRAALGRVLAAAGQRVEGVRELERALEIMEKEERQPRHVAETRLSLAKAIWPLPESRARALRLAKDAIVGLEQSGPLALEALAGARRWLTAHDSGAR